MKRMTLIVISLLTLLILCEVSACAQTDGFYHDEFGSVIYSIPLDVPDVKRLPTLTCTPLDFSQMSNIYSLFGDQAYHLLETIVNNVGTTYCYFESDDSFLTITDGGNLFFGHEMSAHIGYITNYSDHNDREGLLDEGELSFMDRSKATEIALQFVQSIEMDCVVERLYSIDKTTYASLYESNRYWIDAVLAGEAKGDALPFYDWPDHDICYFAFLQLAYEGVPVLYTDFCETDHFGDWGTDINMLVFPNGIKAVEIRHAYALEPIDEPQEIISFEEAIQIYNNTKGQILRLEPVVIDRIKLCYQVQPGDPITARPVWVFYVQHPTTEDDIIFYEKHLIDARTGEVEEG